MCPGIYKKSFPTAISRMHNQPLCLFHQIKEKGHFGLVPFRNIYPEIPVFSNDVYFIQLEEHY